MAILGAGVIGLSLAFELARRGASVAVYDPQEPAGGASWAAAGMLAPYSERLRGELRTLCEESLRLYPHFVDAVGAASSIDPRLQMDGIIRGAHSDDEASALRRLAGELRAEGKTTRVLSREEALLVEPALGRSLRAALLVEGEGHVDNRRLCRALVAACESSGVTIRANAQELAVECDARRVLGVRSSGGFHPCESLVNAAGAWAALPPGIPPSAALPVRPVKGQMLALQMPANFIRRAIWVRDAYLVPRRDGRLLVGATVEEAGYDVRVTARGVEHLLRSALDAVPALRDFSLTETWAGLRPGTPDEKPLLGATLLSGYYAATGHYRNGVLLAPATAHLLAEALESKKSEGLAPFSPLRFDKQIAAG